MPCKFVSHIKWPLKGTELEERSGSDGRPWLASRLHPSSLTASPPTTAAAAGEEEGGQDCDVWWLGWTQAGMVGVGVVLVVT